MAAKIVICVLAAILLYGTGVLFWLAIISAILIAGFAGAYIAAKPEMKKTRLIGWNSREPVTKR